VSTLLVILFINMLVFGVVIAIMIFVRGVLTHLFLILILIGVGENRVGGKNKRGFVDVKVSRVLRVVGDCSSSLLFFVIETFLT
jgi:hypothetical protein